MTQETPSTFSLSKISDLITLITGAFWIGSLAIAVWQFFEKQESSIWAYCLVSGALLVVFVSCLAWSRLGPVYRTGKTLHAFLSYAHQVIQRLSKQSLEITYKKEGQNASQEVLQNILELGRDAKKHFADNKQITDAVDGAEFLANQLRHPVRLTRHFAAFLQTSKILRKKLTQEFLANGLKDPDELDGRILEAIRDILDLVESAFNKLVEPEPVTAVFKTVHPTNPAFLSCTHSRRASSNRVEHEPYIRKEGSLGGYVMDSGKSLICDSIEDERIKGKFLMGSWPDRANFFQSAVLVPVIVNGQRAGVLGIDCLIKGAFQSDAINLLALAADHIALLLQISDFIHKTAEIPTKPLDETQSPIDLTEVTLPGEQVSTKTPSSQIEKDTGEKAQGPVDASEGRPRHRKK